MSDIIRNENKCLVKSTKANSFVEAEIMEFEFQKKMTVVVNKQVKINMKWNGKLYEGRAAGLDFLSDGPKITRTQTTLRG